MMPDKETQTQIISLVLIVAAAMAIGIGSHYGWHDLVTFGLTFGGTGTGLLTGHHLTNNGGNSVNPTN